MGGRRSQSQVRCPDGGTGAAGGAASPRGHPRSRIGLLLAVLFAVSGFSGCGAFSAPEREEARAVVTTEEEAEVRIITSTRFTLDGGGQGDPGGQQTPGVTLEEADTALAVPRFDRTFDISETRRFFIQVEPTDTVSVQATLEVFIDGESLGQLAGDLQDEPLRDVFASVEF